MRGRLQCARQEALRHDTELYRRFLAATARGYRRAMEDEEAVVRAMSAALWHVSPAVIRASTRKIRDSWFTPEGRWGEIQADLVDSYTRWMREGGWTTAPVEATCGAWRNDLLA
ncbi:hypothetical protein [Schaalia sp. 19OD2882]|uniref:hypothetical protein n=1 Tax=Schaalia sp. 19OD2882 TaxID=2794089 RepID=UPI0020A83735|nr:hypothetical protein [Schaalia sp. 19OD2882]